MMLTVAVMVMIKVIIASNRKKCYVIRIFFLFIIKLSILIVIQVRYNLIEIRLCGLVMCYFVGKSLPL